ncbi:MAG: hypothetical protein E6Q90_00020 [Actinobacteria bacterium]|nr:MAG: hypothetical protein E6Q90_00020 [Actinomycetota bacterium]
MRKSTKFAAAAGAAAVVLVAGTAFTASNTLPNAVAGSGSNTVSGVTVVAYNYGFTDDDITSIAFTLDEALPAGQSFAIDSTINAVESTTCVVSDATTITCTYPTGVTLELLESTSLTVLPDGPVA